MSDFTAIMIAGFVCTAAVAVASSCGTRSEDKARIERVELRQKNWDQEDLERRSKLENRVFDLELKMIRFESRCEGSGAP